MAKENFKSDKPLIKEPKPSKPLITEPKPTKPLITGKSKSPKKLFKD